MQASSHVTSLIETGLRGTAVDIECQLSQGLPGMVIVGSAAQVVSEAKQRLRAAFKQSKLSWPRRRITVNLAPADLPKDDTGFDLAIAAAVIRADLSLQTKLSTEVAVIGELALDGTVRPVRGLIGKLLAGRQLGIRQYMVPAANLAQARLVPGVTLLPVGHLTELFRHLTQQQGLPRLPGGQAAPASSLPSNEPVLEEVAGQEIGKRALLIAAAGGHNLLYSGPPGVGKSLLARCLTGILPPLVNEEVLEVTHLHSLVSPAFSQVITWRPLRQPHHTASTAALLGGGQPLRPGEISLSHRGVLFLDELPEFNNRSLQALRQPLEDQQIYLARNRQAVSLPAAFQLVATANLCPCGYRGSLQQACVCPGFAIKTYLRRLSGPLLDRIDLFVSISPTASDNLLDATNNGLSSAEARRQVAKARQRQQRRYGDATLNAHQTTRRLRQTVRLSPEGRQLLASAGDYYHLSSRAYLRLLKAARTIADLADSATVEASHVGEALQFRRAF